jgi:general L-amino acid transport system substrate-binding protein
MTICVVKGTTPLATLERFFSRRGIKHTPLLVDSAAEGVRSVIDGRCGACTSERSVLAGLLETDTDARQKLAILPIAISREPLAPAIRQGDEQWATIIRWVLFALIEAEERGVTSANVRSLQRETADSDLRWFLNNCGERAKTWG